MDAEFSDLLMHHRFTTSVITSAYSAIAIWYSLQGIVQLEFEVIYWFEISCPFRGNITQRRYIVVALE